jgi:hypothetical protein
VFVQVLARSVEVTPDTLSFNVAVAQSYVTVSGQCTAYQKESVGLPEGSVNVCATELSREGEVLPTWAPYVPECLAAVETRAVPVEVQGERAPVSKPPLVREEPPAGVTVSETVAVCVTPPPVPVTVMVSVPAAVEAPTAMVIVEEPEPGAAMEVGLKLTVVPEGAPEEESEIAELNPPDTLVEIVLVPDPPWTTETDPGEAEIVKSGVCVPPQEGNLKLPMRVCQWKLSPLLA